MFCSLSGVKKASFLGLRQRISTFRIETAPVSDDVEVDDEPIPWTRVDWLILFLKCLIWACCQVLAIKVLCHKTHLFIKPN